MDDCIRIICSFKKGAAMFFSKNTVIFSEEAEGNSFFWIQTGEVSVYRNYGKETEVCLDVFTSGDYFGEMAVIDNAPRSATAVATQDSEIVEIKIDDIKEVIKLHPNVIESFIKTMTQRVRNLNDTYMDACKTIAQMSGQLENTAPVQDDNLSHKVEKYKNIYESLYARNNKIIKHV